MSKSESRCGGGSELYTITEEWLPYVQSFYKMCSNSKELPEDIEYADKYYTQPHHNLLFIVQNEAICGMICLEPTTYECDCDEKHVWVEFKHIYGNRKSILNVGCQIAKQMGFDTALIKTNHESGKLYEELKMHQAYTSEHEVHYTCGFS